MKKYYILKSPYIKKFGENYLKSFNEIKEKSSRIKEFTKGGNCKTELLNVFFICSLHEIENTSGFDFYINEIVSEGYESAGILEKAKIVKLEKIHGLLKLFGSMDTSTYPADDVLLCMLSTFDKEDIAEYAETEGGDFLLYDMHDFQYDLTDGIFTFECEDDSAVETYINENLERIKLNLEKILTPGETVTKNCFLTNNEFSNIIKERENQYGNRLLSFIDPKNFILTDVSDIKNSIDKIDDEEIILLSGLHSFEFESFLKLSFGDAAFLYFLNLYKSEKKLDFDNVIKELKKINKALGSKFKSIVMPSYSSSFTRFYITMPMLVPLLITRYYYDIASYNLSSDDRDYFSENPYEKKLCNDMEKYESTGMDSVNISIETLRDIYKGKKFLALAYEDALFNKSTKSIDPSILNKNFKIERIYTKTINKEETE